MKKIFIFILVIAVFSLTLWNKVGSSMTAKPWMEEQIHEDLGFFSKEDLNPTRIETSFENISPELFVVHFQIKNNQIYWQKNWDDANSSKRLRKVCRMLYMSAQKTKLPDVSFLMTLHDGLTELPIELKSNQHLPILTFAKTQKVQNAILFPDPLTEEFARKKLKRMRFEQLKPGNFWSSKIEKAFWRGGTTGGKYFMEDWYTKPRVQLALLSQYYPNEIDAGFSTFSPMGEDVKTEMLKCLPKVDWVAHKKHLKYKYLVIADGHTCTYPRFYLGLAANSVVFKHDSDHYQWFYKLLKPYEHYIPVKADFSDLPEKVQWARAHDKEVKKIASRANRLIMQNLEKEHIYCYIDTLLKEYADLQSCPFELSEKMQPYEPLKKTIKRS